MAVSWGSQITEETDGQNPLAQEELVSLFPDLGVIDHHETTRS
jgi:hypothetical protein